MSPSEIGEEYASSEQFKFKIIVKEKTNLVYYFNEFDLSTQSNYSFIVGVDGTNPHIGLTTEMDSIPDSKGCWAPENGEIPSSTCTYLYESNILSAGNLYFQISHIFNISESFTLEFGGTYRWGWGSHFPKYLEETYKPDISFFQSAHNVYAIGLLLGINYHI